MNRWYLALAGLLMTLISTRALADQIDAVFFDNRFGTINDATGAFTQIGTLPIGQAAGIAWDYGTLYAQDLQSDLISIDAASGVASLLGSSGLQLSSVGFAGGTNGLFEVDSMSDLYSIDPLTGAAILIGATGMGPNYRGWDTSISDDGSFLYFTAGGAGAIDELYRIDPLTGIATDLGSTGVSGISGSAIVNGDLELFQYSWSGNVDYIYSAALGSTSFTAGTVLSVQAVDGGVPDPFGSLGFGSLGSGGSESTPEPVSLLLFSSGLVVLALRGDYLGGRDPITGEGVSRGRRRSQ